MKNTMIVFVTCLLIISALLSVRNYNRKIENYKSQKKTLTSVIEMLEEKHYNIVFERDSLQAIVSKHYFKLDSINFVNMNLKGE